MSSDQVRAAIAVLRKTMPDLAATHLTGDADKPIVTKVVYAWADQLQPETPETFCKSSRG